MRVCLLEASAGLPFLWCSTWRPFSNRGGAGTTCAPATWRTRGVAGGSAHRPKAAQRPPEAS